MKPRLHMQNDTHMVEYPDTRTGMIQIRAFRRNHPEFKGRHIKSVIQAYADRIITGTVYSKDELRGMGAYYR